MITLPKERMVEIDRPVIHNRERIEIGTAITLPNVLASELVHSRKAHFTTPEEQAAKAAAIEAAKPPADEEAGPPQQSTTARKPSKAKDLEQ